MKDKERTILAENLIRLRKTMGLTQNQVAKALGIERSRYAHYEGETTPSSDILRNLASILNVTMDELLYSPDQIQELHERDTISIDGFLFNELKNEEKELIMTYRLLSAKGKQNVKAFALSELDKEDL